MQIYEKKFDIYRLMLNEYVSIISMSINERKYPGLKKYKYQYYRSSG